MSNFKFDASDLVNSINSYSAKAEAAVKMYADNSALKFQNYARKNRKWVDRTGHARQRLTGYTGQYSSGIRIYIAHGVDYGVYLEKAHEEKYAILDETVTKVGAEEVMPGFNHLLDRLDVKK